MILQRLSKEDYPYTKGIAKVYDRVGKQSAKNQVRTTPQPTDNAPPLSAMKRSNIAPTGDSWHPPWQHA